MKKTTSALALTAAMLLSTVAFAQTRRQRQQRHLTECARQQHAQQGD
jgi:hypothetical protein